MIDLFEMKIKDLGGVDNISNVSIDLQINALLPNYMKHILDNYAGSYFNKDVIVSNLDNIPISSSGSIGLGQFLDYTNDKELIESLDDRFLENYVPFIEGAAGDYFLIGFDNTNLGKVYYWYHESTDDDEIYLSFDSFEEFIENLSIDNNSEEDNRKVVSINLDF